MDSAQDKDEITTYTDLSTSAQPKQCLLNKLNGRFSTRWIQTNEMAAVITILWRIAARVMSMSEMVLFQEDTSHRDTGRPQNRASTQITRKCYYLSKATEKKYVDILLALARF